LPWKIKFEDDTEIAIRGLFVAEGTATSIDFARKLGAKVGQNKILVSSTMKTNVPGLYAAGDCTGGLLQISTAVAEGAIAGTEIIKFIRKSKEEK
jgi:thioredoxin reductase (NADPH)